MRQTPSPLRNGAPTLFSTTWTLVNVSVAGSERVSHTGATGLRLQEAGSINRSLAALSDVIKVIYPTHPPRRELNCSQELARGNQL